MIKILVINKEALFYNYYKQIGLGVSIYRELSSSVLKALRRIHLNTKLPFKTIWFNKDFKIIDFNELTTVIVFDSLLSVMPANYLRKHYKHLRIIYWHWNHIYNPQIFEPLNNTIERWTYDVEDLQKYNLRFNTQFYISDISRIVNNNVRDCFFIGAVKERGKYINECEDIINRAGLSKTFILGGNNRHDRERQWVPYDKVLEMIQTSRCVVDIVPDEQHGMTLRPLEALFHKKKLITNFSEIKKMDFYHPNNVFIMGEDDPETLHDFIYSPFNEEVLVFVNGYDIRSWLKRFDLPSE